MAILTSEVARIKVELGYNALSISALPYALDGITQLFEQVVQPYLESGEINSSSTTVTPQASPTLVTLALRGPIPTGIKVGDRIIVDQDLAQEAAHVAGVTMNTIDVALTKAHVGLYPITVEGGESIARGYLNECINIALKISKSATTAGLKRVDKIEFYAATTQQKGIIEQQMDLQKYWRNELASCLGVPNLRDRRGAANQNLEPG